MIGIKKCPECGGEMHVYRNDTGGLKYKCSGKNCKYEEVL